MSTVHTTGEPTAIGASDRALAAGDVVGEYVIDELIGKGGFGTVYRATHPLIGKQAAIKVLSRRYSSDETVVSRFVAEARAVNRIRHRNIIDIFAFGELADGRHYYVMELLEGEPLDQYLERRGPLPLAEALPILKAIAKALDAAHAKGIAHRDLKPENIFLARDDEGAPFPKLLDFGIAKLMTPEELQVKHRTATGAPIGTPYYMSPEQCRGKDVDHRTDIYAFGIVAYRLLTGEFPFEADGYLDLMMMQINSEPAPPSTRNPDLSPVIDAAIAAMMRKDPSERPASVSAAVAGMFESGQITPGITPGLTPHALSLRTAAARIAGSAPTVSPSAATQLSAPSLELPPVARPKRTGLWIAVAGVIVAAGAIGGFVMTRGGSTTPPDAPAARAPGPQVVAPPPPEVVVPPDAAPAPATAKHVILTIDGAPDGTEVKMAGKSMGFTPSIELETGTSEVVLTFFADGYLPSSVTVTPDQARTVKIALKKRARPSGTPGKDDIFHVIPGLER